MSEPARLLKALGYLPACTCGHGANLHARGLSAMSSGRILRCSDYSASPGGMKQCWCLRYRIPRRIRLEILEGQRIRGRMKGDLLAWGS